MSRKLQYEQLVKAGALGRLPFIQVDSLDVDQARVVFPGTEGAYSEAAMKCYFGEKCNSFYVKTFREAMEPSRMAQQILPFFQLKIPPQVQWTRCMICWLNLKIILWAKR